MENTYIRRTIYHEQNGFFQILGFIWYLKNQHNTPHSQITKKTPMIYLNRCIKIVWEIHDEPNKYKFNSLASKE